MCGQLIFTSCRNSRDNTGSGFQVFTYSDDLPESLRDELSKAGSYSLDGLDLPTLIEEGQESRYPVAFRYNLHEYGIRSVTQSVYLGVDWSGTRFGTNYISHSYTVESAELEDREVYPIQYCQSDSFEKNLGDRVKVESIPPALEIKPPAVGTTVTLQAVRDFLSDEGRLEPLKSMVADILGGGRVVFTDTQENIPLWIGAITMLFPAKVLIDVPFSTFELEGRLATKPSGIYATFSEPGVFRLESAGSSKMGWPISKYISKVYSDESLRDEVFNFMKRAGFDSNREEIEDILRLFWFCRGETELMGQDELHHIECYFAKHIDQFDESVLVDYMDRVVGEPDLLANIPAICKDILKRVGFEDNRRHYYETIGRNVLSRGDMNDPWCRDCLEWAITEGSDSALMEYLQPDVPQLECLLDMYSSSEGDKKERITEHLRKMQNSILEKPDGKDKLLDVIKTHYSDDVIVALDEKSLSPNVKNILSDDIRSNFADLKDTQKIRYIQKMDGDMIRIQSLLKTLGDSDADGLLKLIGYIVRNDLLSDDYRGLMEDLCKSYIPVDQNHGYGLLKRFTESKSLEFIDKRGIQKTIFLKNVINMINRSLHPLSKNEYDLKLSDMIVDSFGEGGSEVKKKFTESIGNSNRYGVYPSCICAEDNDNILALHIRSCFSRGEVFANRECGDGSGAMAFNLDPENIPAYMSLIYNRAAEQGADVAMLCKLFKMFPGQELIVISSLSKEIGADFRSKRKSADYAMFIQNALLVKGCGVDELAPIFTVMDQSQRKKVINAVKSYAVTHVEVPERVVRALESEFLEDKKRHKDRKFQGGAEADTPKEANQADGGSSEQSQDKDGSPAGDPSKGKSTGKWGIFGKFRK